MNQSKEVPDLVVFMNAAIKAIDELPAQAMRAEFTCPICGGGAWAHAQMKRGTRTLATGGCEKCGMAMIV